MDGISVCWESLFGALPLESQAPENAFKKGIFHITSSRCPPPLRRRGTFRIQQWIITTAEYKPALPALATLNGGASPLLKAFWGSKTLFREKGS